MSMRLAVPIAVKAMIAAAVAPIGMIVEGVDGEAAEAERIGPPGRVVVETGDPGLPDITLSPLTYDYDHQIPVTITAFAMPGLTAEQVLDQALALIAAAIVADRQLGGLVIWLDASAPPTSDDAIEGAAVSRFAEATLVASYSTNRPL